MAERCGVSTATVARVLHNKGYVAAETRARVEAAIADTGYQINAVAQGLRRHRTFTIGHILDSIAPNLFFAEVALGVEQEALSHGCSVLMYNVQGSVQRERLGVQTLIRRRVDAILFTTPVDESNVLLAMAAGIPVVQVERVTAVESHAVTVDNYVGSFRAVEHLVNLGHKRIAFIGQDPLLPGEETVALHRRVEEERLAGYLDALRTHAVPIDDDLIAMGSYYSLEDRKLARDGYALMRALLAVEPRPTAVFATCDLLAAGVLQALYERSLRVPADVSVVGFDDTYASYLTPPLTTVEQPMADIGKAAARIVLQLLEHPDVDGTSPHTVRLSSQLVVRASTGPAPQQAPD